MGTGVTRGLSQEGDCLAPCLPGISPLWVVSLGLGYPADPLRNYNAFRTGLGASQGPQWPFSQGMWPWGAGIPIPGGE